MSGSLADRHRREPEAENPAPFAVGHDVRVPEGDTIFRAAARLHAALAGRTLVDLEVRRDPRGRRGPPPGTEITSVGASGKHLLMHFADGHVLHTHMQMTGAWHVYAPGERWRRPGHTARVIVRVDDGTTAVCFAAPIVELRRERDARDLTTRASRMLDRLGPDLCEAGTDLDAVLDRLARLDPGTELAAALLDQRVAAGIGNVFKSEVCWAERVSPFVAIGALDVPTRRRVYETAQRQLTSNLTTARRTTYGTGLAVYRRAGRRCPRCRDAIVSRRDRNGRSTYWCAACQPDPGDRSGV
jgi:endonuclease-8